MKPRVWVMFLVIALMVLSPAQLALADTTYTVQPGDTLSSIARTFGVAVDAIVQANNIANPNFIVSGQVLTIPGVDGPVNAETTTPAPAPAQPAAPAQTTADGRYVVQRGDSLSKIAGLTGVSVNAIVAANEISNPNLIAVGQQLIIPGWAGEVAAAPAASPAPAAPAPAAPEIVGANLLPNPSFEEGWYFFNGVLEWQIPNGWMLFVDEGPNALTPGSGGNFLRPEVRVVPAADLPAAERDHFIFDGSNTVKSFKGGAPTNFAIFTDVHLQPGTYRLTINFFPDVVAGYDQERKVWAADPLAAEVRFIQDNGGTDWMPVTPGTKNTLTYNVTVNNAGPVRLGAAFRNRFVQQNNGWFLDGWTLQAVATP
ncbi:MAG TPA: LysM domain-containing protein [Anaerolineae bacterium]